MGVRRLDTEEFSRAFAERNKKLLEEKEGMTSEKARRFCDLVIDLNKLGIDGNDKVKSEQQLLKKCYTLKKEALEKRSLDIAKLFIRSADELALARDAFIEIMTMKNEKQIEVIEFLKRSDLIEKRDLEEIASAIFVDTLASIDAGKLSPFGTAFKAGTLSSKFLVTQVQKTSMSPKILGQAIWLRQRSQERFRAWRQSPSIRPLVG
jgi:hypothetical protein